MTGTDSSHDSSTNRQYKYRAFISYSHQDRKWGDWLHKKLETYKVPRQLNSASGGEVPRRIFPVFRDREELPTSADLGEVINEALRQSEYLIVICSPHAARSIWVNEEIRYFKSLGRGDRVLTLIVDGEPNGSDKKGMEDLECFPPAVRFQVDTTGTLLDSRTEPIAGDARKHCDGMNNAFLKLVAGILNADYAVLNDREKRRRTRKAVAILMLISILVALFLAGWMVLENKRAQDLSEEQARTQAAHEEAEAQRQEAENQRAEAERNLSEAARQQARSLVNAASLAMQEKRYLSARYLFLKALDLVEDTQETSELRNSINAHLDSLPLYRISSLPLQATPCEPYSIAGSSPYGYYPHYHPVSFFDDKTLVVAGNGNISFFNMEDGTIEQREALRAAKYVHIHNPGLVSSTALNNISPQDIDTVLLPLLYHEYGKYQSFQLLLLNALDSAAVSTSPPTTKPAIVDRYVSRTNSYLFATIGKNGYILAVTKGSMSIYDPSSPHDMVTLSVPQHDYGTPMSCAVSDDLDLAAIGISQGGIYLYDIRNGTQRALGFADIGIGAMDFSDDAEYLAHSLDGHDETESYLYLTQTHGDEPSELLGSHEEAIFSIRFIPEGDLLVSLSGDAVKIWNYATQELLAVLEHHAGNEPGAFRTLEVSPDGSHLAIVTETGNVLLWDIRSIAPMASIAYEPFEHALFSPQDDTFITCASRPDLWDVGSWEVRRSLPLWAKNFEYDTSTLHQRPLAYSPDGSSLLVADSFSLLEVEAASGTVRREMLHDVDVLYASYSPDGKYVFANGNEGELLSKGCLDCDGVAVSFAIDVSGTSILAESRQDPSGWYNRFFTGNDRMLMLFGNEIVDVPDMSLLSIAPEDISDDDAMSYEGESYSIDYTTGTVTRRNVLTGMTESTILPELMAATDHLRMRGDNFSSRGEILAMHSSDSIHVFDLSTFQLLARYYVPGDTLFNVAISDNGRWLLSSHTDGTMRVWRVPEIPVPAFGTHQEEMTHLEGFYGLSLESMPELSL